MTDPDRYEGARGAVLIIGEVLREAPAVAYRGARSRASYAYDVVRDEVPTTRQDCQFRRCTGFAIDDIPHPEYNTIDVDVCRKHLIYWYVATRGAVLAMVTLVALGLWILVGTLP